MDQKNYLNLDIRALHTFLTIMETGSITLAAERLNVTQSAVSHGLEKLRGIFHDPLFLRAGRGIKPTPRAEQLFTELKPLLANIKALTETVDFDPATADIEWTIAANDFQRDTMLPAFYQQVAPQVKRLALNIIPSQLPSIELLRDGDVDIAISPVPPNAPDILQKRLFTTHASCFYDGSARSAPTTEEDFRQAHYIGLTFMMGKQVDSAAHSIAMATEDNIVVRVSNFSGLASFLQDSRLLAIAPILMKRTLLKEFDEVPLPYKPPALNMYMLWHQRCKNDASHAWLREQLLLACNSLTGMDS